MTRVQRWFATALLLVSGVSAAHDVPPQVTQFVASADGSIRLAGATFGALINRPPSSQFSWVCEEAIGFKNSDSPVWAVTNSGAMFSAALTGLYVSRDSGCRWAPHPQVTTSGASDIIQVGAALLLTTARFSAANGTWRSVDDGLTWQLLGSTSTTEFYSGLRSAPSRPQRLYVSAWYYQPASNGLLKSDDSGATFERVTLTSLLPATGAFRVLVVDPDDADTLYATVSNDDINLRSWLLRSADGGRTFSTVTSVLGRITSAAISGSKLLVAAADRLYAFNRSPPFAEAIAPLPSAQACVSSVGSKTFVCADAAIDGFALAEWSGEPTPAVLRWPQITGPLECPADSPVTTTCASVWSTQRIQLGLATQPAVGAVDNELGPAGRSCSTAPAFQWWAFAFVGSALRRRRLQRR